MRVAMRCGVAMLFGLAALAIGTPVASASFGVSFWDAGTCATNTEPAVQCTKATPERGYTQAAGHPNFGITEFRFNTTALGLPDGMVKDVRVDLPKGLAINPEATPQCTQTQLEASTCPLDSQVGTNYATLINIGLPVTVPIPVYNIVPQQGEPARFGMTVPFVGGQIYLEGGIAWDSDYHEYFTIHVADNVPLTGTRLVFNGQAGDGTFITLPSQCSASPADFPVTTLHVTSYAGDAIGPLFAQTPRGVDGCGAVPFKPTVSVTPDSTGADQATGVTVDVKLPQKPDGAGGVGGINSSTLRNARVTLPDGLTINPATATGLEACTDEQLGEGTTRPVACPAASRVGSVAMEAPALPAGSLTGDVYIGQPLSNDPASGQEYRLFLDGESARYGVSVRLTGHVQADPQTGQLTATFTDNPDVPLSEFSLHFDGGDRSALATPLACGPATTTSVLEPWSGGADATPSSAFTVDGCSGGFAPALSTPTSSTTAGGATTFTADVARAAGQETLSRIALDLPPGLMGFVSRVDRCGDADAAAGTCPDSSRIGTTTVAAGSGGTPFTLGGNVYLTGPYNGAPFGMSIVTRAIAGPFDLGTVVVRAGIFVDPHDAHLRVVSDPLPTIVGGVPLRLRDVQVTIDRANFLYNPTNCGALATSGTIDSTAGTSAPVSSPFQATGCAALPFKPQFSAQTRGKLTFKRGAALDVHVGMPAGSANIRSISVRLPKELPSRLIPTINNACLIAQFQADYTKCPVDSFVGTVKAVSPVVSQPLTGPAYIVAVPNDVPRLELKLFGHGEAEGVEVDLEGSIIIDSGGGRTKATFATIPDVPISSFDVDLPAGPHSALDAPSDNLCKGPIKLDLSILGQNGLTQNSTKTIAVAACPKIAKVKIVKATPTKTGVRLRILAPAAGRMTVQGHGLKTVKRSAVRKLTYSVTLKLTKAGKRTIARKGVLRTPVAVKFKPVNAPKSSRAKTKTLKIGHSL